MIIEIDNVLVQDDILREMFCCDLQACKGVCCIEGDAGAPVKLDEVIEIEDALDEAWGSLSAQAQSVIDKQGVVYTDREGDLVTSIVGGKDCVFTYYDDLDLGSEKVHDCCLCALEKQFRAGKTRFCKPISCSLYPIREKQLSNGYVGLNYNRWKICQPAVDKGNREGIKVYQFLKEPLVRRFGAEWYEELCVAARMLEQEEGK